MATGDIAGELPNGEISDIFRKIPSENGNLPFGKDSIKAKLGVLFFILRKRGMSCCDTCRKCAEELLELRSDLAELIHIVESLGGHEQSIDVDDCADDEWTGEEEVRGRFSVHEQEYGQGEEDDYRRQGRSSSSGHRY